LSAGHSAKAKYQITIRFSSGTKSRNAKAPEKPALEALYLRIHPQATLGPGQRFLTKGGYVQC